MRYLLSIALVALFFVLPVYLDFLQVTMYTYLLLGFHSAFPAPLISTLVFAAALLLIISFACGNSRFNQILFLVPLIIMNIPVAMIIAKQWQLNSVWSAVAYLAYLLLLLSCSIQVLRKVKPSTDQ